MTKKNIRIQKGHDPFLEVTPIAEYAKQRGWRVLNEVVTIAMPKGKELEQFQQDIEWGKIVVVSEQKEN